MDNSSSMALTTSATGRWRGLAEIRVAQASGLRIITYQCIIAWMATGSSKLTVRQVQPDGSRWFEAGESLKLLKPRNCRFEVTTIGLVPRGSGRRFTENAEIHVVRPLKVTTYVHHFTGIGTYFSKVVAKVVLENWLVQIF